MGIKKARSRSGPKSVLQRQIKKLRDRRGLTQAALAERLNVDQSAVAHWERGKSAPEIDLLPRVAEVLGTTIDELYREAA